MVFITRRHDLIAARHVATNAPPPPYAHTMPPRRPPTYGTLWSLSRRSTIYRDAARHIATNAPPPPYAHTMPPRRPPTYGTLWSLSRRSTIYRDAARRIATNARHRMRIPCNHVGLPLLVSMVFITTNVEKGKHGYRLLVCSRASDFFSWSAPTRSGQS